MKKTHVPLLKFTCDSRECHFECYVNQNNHLLTHYNPNMSALLDWVCPDCGSGKLRYASSNTMYEFSLTKSEREPEPEERSQQAG